MCKCTLQIQSYASKNQEHKLCIESREIDVGMSDTENNFIIVVKRISMNNEYTKGKLRKASCNTSLFNLDTADH